MVAGQTDTIQFMAGTTFRTREPKEKKRIANYCKSVGNKQNKTGNTMYI